MPSRPMSGYTCRSRGASEENETLNLFKTESFTQFFSKNCGVEGRSPRCRVHAKEGSL